MKALIILFLFLVLLSDSFAQGMFPPKAFVIGNYSFFTQTDTTDYSCIVRVKKDGVPIAAKRFEEVTFEDVSLLEDNGGNKIFLVSAFTGGAHCCTTLYSISVNPPSIKLIDSLFLGNAGYGIEDINNDGKKEIVTGSDMLAYAFTNYAETRFPAYIVKFDKGHFSNVTSDFRDLLTKEINDLTDEMNDFLKEAEFKCEPDGTDTFNSPSGTLKTILAAIAADYKSLGETQKGFDLIDKMYNCPDKDAYVTSLRNDFGIK